MVQHLKSLIINLEKLISAAYLCHFASSSPNKEHITLQTVRHRPLLLNLFEELDTGLGPRIPESPVAFRVKSGPDPVTKHFNHILTLEQLSRFIYFSELATSTLLEEGIQEISKVFIGVIQLASIFSTQVFRLPWARLNTFLN
jgi:hypothetical protein